MHHFHPFSWITSGNLLAFISLMEFPLGHIACKSFPVMSFTWCEKNTAGFDEGESRFGK